MIKKQFLWLLGFVAGLAAIGLFFQRWNRQFLQFKVKTKGIPASTGQLHLGKQIQVTTILDSPASKIWQLLLTSGLTEHLSWPFLYFSPIDQQNLPALWPEDQPVRVRLRLFDLIPLGWHIIRIKKVDHAEMIIETQESGQLISLWNHTIILQPAEDNRTVYTDTIDLYAASQTSVISKLVGWFFRYRQTRLRWLASNLT